jgi:hypothetical protein
MAISSQYWRWRQHVTPKRWYLCTNLHGFIFQKNTIIISAVRISAQRLYHYDLQIIPRAAFFRCEFSYVRRKIGICFFKFLIDETGSEHFCHGKSSRVLSYFHQIWELTPPTQMHLCPNRFWNRFPGLNNSWDIGRDGMRKLRRRREFDFRKTEFFFATTAKAPVGPRQHQMQWGEQSFSKTNNLTTYISHGLEFGGTFHIQPHCLDVFYPDASTQDLCKRFMIDSGYFIHKLQNL